MIIITYLRIGEQSKCHYLRQIRYHSFLSFRSRER